MTAKNIVHVTTETFESEVIASTVPVVVDFWAPWCGPCRMIAPVLEDVAPGYDGRLKIAKVNVDEEPALAGRYGIRGIPTLKAFKDGQEVDEMVGFGGREMLEAWVVGLLGE